MRLPSLFPPSSDESVRLTSVSAALLFAVIQGCEAHGSPRAPATDARVAQTETSGVEREPPGIDASDRPDHSDGGPAGASDGSDGEVSDADDATHADARAIHAGGAARAAPVTDDDDSEYDRDVSLVGMTRAQVLALRGPPYKERGQEWIYRPKGCREIEDRAVLTFRGDVVAAVRREKHRTGKICGRQ